MNERSIFMGALEREDPAERTAYLDGACRGDVELRKRIDTLLRSYQSAENFLETPPAALIATITGGNLDASGGISLEFLEQSDKAGCLGTLGQYEVVEVLGRGGMGMVLRAYDTKLNRVVAIKVISPELATNATAVKRFLREAQAAAAVNHEHVVTIHAIHDEFRLPYIVMECIEGPSLQEKMERKGGLELKEILRIGMQAAAGLAAAHQQGLVHRDVKPANILLENGVERVKLTDFGLARAVDDVSMTQPGLIAGTPQYMSPEQASGQIVDHRSDLFSLGSVLYMMCAGRPPFRADTSIAMLRAVMEDVPQSVRELNSDIPVWLEAIISHLLAKDPEHRFQSARDVSDLLGQWLSHVQNPQVQAPPVRTRFKNGLPNGFPRQVASTWNRVPFTILVGIYLLCVTGFAMAIAIEVESVLVAGPVCSGLGIAVAFIGWRRLRSLLSVALGLSTVLLSLLVTAVIIFFNLGPARAQDPVSWLVLVYELIAVPIGMFVLWTTHLVPPKEGWLCLIRFKLRTLLGVIVVAAIASAAVRFAVRLSFGAASDSPIAWTVGVFVATVLLMGWMMLRAVHENSIDKMRPFREEAGLLPRRRVVVTVGILIAAVLGFAILGSLMLWEYGRTNFGYVVFSSPVSDLKIERLRNGRVERVYDTLHGGGTRWHVPVGQWEFRIQGNRSDYRLSQSRLVVERGRAITLQIVPTAAASATGNSAAWDKLIAVAEGELEVAQTRVKAGLTTAADLHKAEAGVLEVKIQRARSHKNQNELVSLLNELIQVREQELAYVRELHQGGRVTQAELQATIRSLVEAQAALEEVKAGNW